MSVYPFLIGCVEDFDNSKPHKLTILGKSYVVWVDKNKTVSILPDACPHLGGALSRGSLVDNNTKVQCPFHVQQFDGQGNLNGIKGKCFVEVPYFKVVNGLIWFGPQDFDEDVIPKFEFITDPKVHLGASAPARVVNSPFRKLLGIGNDVNHAAGTHNNSMGIDRVVVEDKNMNGGSDFQVRLKFYFKQFTFKQKLKSPFLFFVNVEKYFSDVFSFFPTLFLSRSVANIGTSYSIFYFYPQDEKSSVSGAIYYSSASILLDNLLKKSSINVLNTIIDEDMFETESQYDVKPAFSLVHDDIRNDVITQWLTSANMMTEESKQNRKNLVVK
jgi:phenylpropionate dioxygenase-like ring-hydroxylating dioxygenase large terminal subunit